MTIEVGEVAMIKVGSIIVEDRARVELGNLHELAANLKEKGLIAPVAVKALSDDKYRLLAGERRFTVIKEHNGLESLISARIFRRDLSELEMKEIEMSENFYRKDMEWWEYDKLTAEIHKLKQAIHGAASPGPTNEGWGGKDTGDLLGITNASVTMALQRNSAREQFPELFENCRSASDATKVIKKLGEGLIKQEIAEKIEKQKSNTLLTDLAKRYIIKDFFEGVKDIPENYFHLVEIDPPYAIDLMDQKKADSETQYKSEDYNEIGKDKYINFLSNLFTSVYRVMADHSWLIVWFAPEPWFEDVYKLLRGSGFGTSRMCGIWTKPTGQSLQPQFKLANSYEMFFYAWKGRPVLNKAGRINLFNSPPVPSQQKVHPTERPIELMEELYETFAFPGSRVLIPFLGSGNGIISAYNKGMDAVGFELSKSYRDSFLLKVNAMKS